MNEFDYTHPKETGKLRECSQCGYLTDIHEEVCAICGHKLELMDVLDKPRLSAIEMEVMLLIANDICIYDIAEILLIPESEIINHIHRIIDKLKVHTRE